jgi:MFS family permease
VAGPAPAAFAADIAPPTARGLTMGLQRTMGDVGFVVGPPLLGWLADNTSFGWGFAANAILMGLAALTFAVVVREHRGDRAREVPAPRESEPTPSEPTPPESAPKQGGD